MAMNGELLVTAKLRDAKERRRLHPNIARERLAEQSRQERIYNFGKRNLRNWKLAGNRQWMKRQAALGYSPMSRPELLDLAIRRSSGEMV